MKTLDEWVPADKVRILVYGVPGVGKTFGAGTFPRPCFMDLDKGIATLRGPEFTKIHGKRDVIYQQFEELNFGKGGVVTRHVAFDQAYEFFETMQKPANADKFDTWVIDSGTTLSEYAANKAAFVLGQMKLSHTFDKAMSTGLFVQVQQDFGAERSLVEQFVRAVRSTQKHFVFICHEHEATNDAGVVTAIRPLLTGKSRTDVPLLFDEVYNLQAKLVGQGMKRFLVTHTNGIRMAKTRYGVPDETPWDWESIKRAIEGTPALASAVTR